MNLAGGVLARSLTDWLACQLGAPVCLAWTSTLRLYSWPAVKVKITAYRKQSLQLDVL